MHCSPDFASLHPGYVCDYFFFTASYRALVSAFIG